VFDGAVFYLFSTNQFGYIYKKLSLWTSYVAVCYW